MKTDMKQVKTRAITAFILNCLIVISTVLAVGVYFVSGPDVLGSSGKDCFKYFTTDSNILVALTALIMLPFNLRQARHPEKEYPRWALNLKLVGTGSVTITLLTVVFFLAPIGAMNGGLQSFLFFFEGNIFALHLSTPLLAIVCFTAFEREGRLPFSACLWALLPTVVYSIVYLVMVVFVGSWTDWYGFTFGGKNYLAPVSMLAMYLVTFAVAIVLRALRKRKE